MQKVLIVEDDQAIREMFRNALEDNGFDVIEAWNGREGVLKAKQDNPDIIVMDIVMPEISGIDALKIIRSDYATRETPILMLTNLDQEYMIEEATSWGAVSYVVKASTTPKLLAEKIRSLLAEKKKSTEK